MSHFYHYTLENGLMSVGDTNKMRWKRNMKEKSGKAMEKGDEGIKEVKEILYLLMGVCVCECVCVGGGGRMQGNGRREMWKEDKD